MGSQNSLKHEWKEVKNSCVPEGTTAVQLKVMEEMFYLGATAFNYILDEAADVNVPIAEGLRNVMAVKAELLDFASKIGGKGE